jgi:hypothetical protein
MLLQYSSPIIFLTYVGGAMFSIMGSFFTVPTALLKLLYWLASFY